MENEGDGGGVVALIGVVGFVGEEIVEPFQCTKQFGAGVEVGGLVWMALIEVVAIGLGESKLLPLCVVFE